MQGSLEMQFSALVLLLSPLLSLADLPDPEKYLIAGDVLQVRLAGFENDAMWPHRAQGLVLISDQHNNTVRLCSDDLSEMDVRRLCYSLGYSGGWEQPLGPKYSRYGGLHTITTLRCQGTEQALEQCPRNKREFGCFLERFRHVELYCTNSWYGPSPPCGKDMGVETAAESNPWSSNEPAVVELGELIGATARTLESERMVQEQMAQERMVQPTTILSAVQFPWTAKLNYYDTATKMWVYRCGAAIVTDRVVLTLAHCVSDIAFYSVTVGDYDTEVQNRFVETFRVHKTFVHPQYSDDELNNDLAIVVLQDKGGLGLQFRPSAMPVCLPTNNAPLFGNRKAVVAGWGKQDTPTTYSMSRFLSIAKVQLYERSACEGHADPSSGIVCAGNPQGGSDACIGDSGAPLVAKIKDRSLLVGLLKEPACGVVGRSSKYVNIQHHADWIKTTVAEIHAQINRANEEEEDDDDDDDEK